MADVLYLLIVAAFFALAALFVKACEIIIGPDETAAPVGIEEPETEPMAA
jgi:hypothetical protein